MESSKREKNEEPEIENIEPHNNHREELCRGNWLSLRRVFFTNKHGDVKTWECVARLHRRGAAMMIATLRPSSRIILVRQFRPPTGTQTLEFPAGLIDDGETAAETAVRELYEETGLRGRVDEVMPPSCNSPGLTGEQITTVLMSVDETSYGKDEPPIPEMEDDEDIETLFVSPDSLLELIRREATGGNAVDSKLLAFALALNRGQADARR